MEDTIKKWLCEWLTKNSWVGSDTIELGQDKSIFELGWIDSVDFISLYSEAEDHYGIEFEDEDFEKIYSMPTVNNITRVIGGKIQ